MVSRATRTLTEALEAVARCIDQVLAGQATNHHWSPGVQEWVARTPSVEG
jgi:hypothetical protein